MADTMISDLCAEAHAGRNYPAAPHRIWFLTRRGWCKPLKKFSGQSSPTPAHLHHSAFIIIDADHHIEDWTFMLAADKLLHAHFDLKRAKQSVRPPAAK